MWTSVQEAQPYLSFINQMSCEISKVFSGLEHHKAIWKNRYYLIYLKSYLTRYLYKLEFIASIFKAVLDWLKLLAFYIKFHMPIKNSFPKWGPILSKGLTKLVFLLIFFFLIYEVFIMLPWVLIRQNIFRRVLLFTCFNTCYNGSTVEKIIYN